MKLLDRKHIHNDLNIQRKAQIDEGVIIAKKVDILREEMISLEAQRAKIIEGSRQELINATSSLIQKKENIESEVNKLNEKRMELLRPLTDEWAELGIAKEEYFTDVKELENREEQLSQTEKEIQKTKDKIESELRLIEETKAVIIQNERSSQEMREKSKQIYDAAETFDADSKQEHRTRESQIKEREKEIETQIKFLEIQKDNLDSRETKLNDKERFINDKYETLLRTINRTK